MSNRLTNNNNNNNNNSENNRGTLVVEPVTVVESNGNG